MMKRIVEQEPAITRVLNLDRKTKQLAPTWQDSHVLEAVCSALESVGDFTDILSQEKYVSVSSLKPLLNVINVNVLNPPTEDDVIVHDLTTEMRDSIKKSLSKRYNDDKINELLCVATFLDPKFKNQYLTEEEYHTVKEKIRMDVSLHVKPVSISNDVHVKHTPAKKTLASLFVKTKKSSDNQCSSVDTLPVDSELVLYLGAPEPDQDSNPLDWWKIHEKSYPTLANFAKKYLCVTATSCPSERLFSKAGQIVNPKRACLKPDTVNMLSFLAGNMSNFVKQ